MRPCWLAGHAMSRQSPAAVAADKNETGLAALSALAAASAAGGSPPAAAAGVFLAWRVGRRGGSLAFAVLGLKAPSGVWFRGSAATSRLFENRIHGADEPVHMVVEVLAGIDLDGVAERKILQLGGNRSELGILVEPISTGMSGNAAAQRRLDFDANRIGFFLDAVGAAVGGHAEPLRSDNGQENMGLEQGLVDMDANRCPEEYRRYRGRSRPCHNGRSAGRKSAGHRLGIRAAVGDGDLGHQSRPAGYQAS